MQENKKSGIYWIVFDFGISITHHGNIQTIENYILKVNLEVSLDF